MTHTRRFFWLAALVVLPGLCFAPARSKGQTEPSVAVNLPDGGEVTLASEAVHGYPAISASSLEPLGWTVADHEAEGEVLLVHRTGLELRFDPGSPFIGWDEELIHLVDSAYWSEEEFFVPLQLIVDLFPGLLPDAYQFDEERFLLFTEGAGSAETPADDTAVTPSGREVPRSTLAEEPPVPPTWSPREGPPAAAVVIIDPGHGGADAGATGPGGVREKDVALSVGLALARELSTNPTIEVRLTRDRDVGVPVWTRGEWATEWRGDRPGVFVSIHVNALPDRAGVRGFETYFLSDARTEHEQRVAAAENAAVAQDPDSGSNGFDPLLPGILSDLRAFDHQQWSALLAEEVQWELGEFHPGPDRGVKQGPFAVITNTLMPSVLVETGFITNPEEERLLAGDEFHRESARAIARALERFLERYPMVGVP